MQAQLDFLQYQEVVAASLLTAPQVQPLYFLRYYFLTTHSLSVVCDSVLALNIRDILMLFARCYSQGTQCVANIEAATTQIQTLLQTPAGQQQLVRVLVPAI